MNDELKQFNIDIKDIQEDNNLFKNIDEAINKMKLVTLKDRFEVVLNNNLIECKEKLTNYRTILGCRISYDNLPREISFIVREDTKPSYEELEQEIDRLNNIINEAIDLLEPFVEIDMCVINGKMIKPALDKLKELKEVNKNEQ